MERGREIRAQEGGIGAGVVLLGGLTFLDQSMIHGTELGDCDSILLIIR